MAASNVCDETEYCESSHVVECIRVAVRMRPLSEREVAFSRAWRHLNSDTSITQISNAGKSLDPLPGRTFFTFDKVFGEKSSTAEVYQWSTKKLVHSVVGGRNGSIFTYGQTSSGKTYTMQGGSSIRSGMMNGGVVHMAAKDLFSDISQVTDRDFVVRVSVIEIYNEEVRDLLSKRNQLNSILVVREDPRRGIFVNATKHEVNNEQTLLVALSVGEKNRTVGSTSLNHKSSRSHLIFTVYVESTPNKIPKETRRNLGIRAATINFVDLAGSEGVRHRGNRSSERRHEGSNINKSLLTLSRVISAIGSTKQPHISFRDSKLTRVLQPALTGNARLSFICCATSSDVFLEETRSTLQFASRIKHITTKTQVNVLDNKIAYERMKEELTKVMEALSLCEKRLHKVEKENKELKSLVKTLSNDKNQALRSLRKTKSESFISSGDLGSSKRVPRIIECSSEKASFEKSFVKAHQDLEAQVDILATVVDQLKSRHSITSKELLGGVRSNVAERRFMSSRKTLSGLPVEISVDNLSVLVSEATNPSVFGDITGEAE